MKITVIEVWRVIRYTIFFFEVLGYGIPHPQLIQRQMQGNSCYISWNLDKYMVNSST